MTLRFFTMTVLTLSATGLFTWNQARSQGWRGAGPAADSSPSSLVLRGTLTAPATAPVAVRLSQLTVPLNSRVTRGEIIGTADPTPAPGQLAVARLQAGEAREERTAAAREVDRWEDLNRQGTLEANAIQSNVYAAEGDRQRAEARGRREEALYRERILPGWEQEAASARRAEAAATVSAERSNLLASAYEMDTLRTRLTDARSSLADTSERLRDAEAAVDRLEQNPGALPVTAPAEGYLVARDASAGLYGIAAEQSRLHAIVPVRESDLGSVRVGQAARVNLAGHPGRAWTAVITGIAPTAGPGGAYDVVVTMENPDGWPLAGSPAEVVIPRTPGR